MSKIIKLSALILMTQLFCAPQVFAELKLSSPIRAYQPYVIKGQEYLVTAQEKINGVMNDYNKYKLLIESGEWKNLALQYGMEKGMEKGISLAGKYNIDASTVRQYGSYAKGIYTEVKDGTLIDHAKQYGMDYAKKEGEKYLQQGKDFISAEAKKRYEKFKSNKKVQKLEESQQKLANAEAKLADYEAAFKNEKMQKNEQISQQLTELYAKEKAPDLTEEEHNKIVEEIAVLEAQKQHNLDNPLENDKTYQGLANDVKKAQEEVKKQTAETSKELEEQQLAEKSNNSDLFSDEDEQNADNKSIYETEINALFLKKDESTESANVARIKKNRNREYYNAIQKAMEVDVNGGVASTKTTEELQASLENSGKAESIFALKNANINVVIESAKSAARVTEALLAEIRLKTTQDMTMWNNKYHLYDYNKPITEFDLDYYELKKEDIKDKANGLIKKGVDKARDYISQNTDKIENYYDTGMEHATDFLHKL